MEKNIEMKVKNSDGSFDTLFPVTKESNVSGAIQNLAPHGYRKLPNGLILQWGAVAVGKFGDSTVKSFFIELPTAFPRQLFHVLCSAHGNVGAGTLVQAWTSGSYTKAGFTVTAHSPAKTDMDVRYLAIGY